MFLIIYPGRYFVNGCDFNVKDLQSVELYEETYDELTFSPAARPIVPPNLGIDEVKALFTLRNIPDNGHVKAYIDNEKP
ncbi:hypothetical protein QGM71_15330 [Virgibacillus sp. C22-A2]|uniref:Uncharacterized protein n=1 Tax=Virgibacillus tibetensis TaxID=3042313 RepID=A0ABU6KHR2_9BACI|nr:hypothetical protein [Virgibacillus sp. C22-A2]